VRWLTFEKGIKAIERLLSVTKFHNTSTGWLWQIVLKKSIFLLGVSSFKESLFLYFQYLTWFSLNTG